MVATFQDPYGIRNMSDSNEEKVLLNDESMDAMHAMQLSVETEPKRQLRDSSSSSESSEMAPMSSDSSSEDEEFSDCRNGAASMGGFGSVGYAREKVNSDNDSDEPPEIPGSPITQKLQVNSTNVMPTGSNSRFLPDRSDTKSTANFVVAEEEYEVKEVEQSRTAEFNASSSSEDEEDSDNERKSRGRNQLQMQMKRSLFDRPKTAAKELENYRDVVPSDFFQQFEGTATLTIVSSPLSTTTNDSASRKTIDMLTNNSTRTASRDRGSGDLNRRQYKLPVPPEVETLFNLTDAYTPEEIEIEAKLEPFLPEFTPSVGSPFDGIKIPRPDGKEENIGVDILLEPSGETNIAELELLMKISMKQQQKLRSRNEIVRSIDRAAQRPQEIDQWMTSVDKAQRTKPPAQVNYKHPMPPLSQLMELWPEEFEKFLTARDTAIPVFSELDLNLKELVKISCVMLDIPVYEGNYVHSLHVLFSLFLEMEAYERDAQTLQR